MPNSDRPRDLCGPDVLQHPPPQITTALRIVGGKWTMLILWQLLGRTCRFNELRKAIPGISQHMLSSTLRGLETEGVITRTVFAEVPPRVEYRLTDHGRRLEKVTRALADWGEAHLQRVELPKNGSSP